MAVRFLGTSSGAVVGTSVELAVPNIDNLKPGDFMIAAFLVQNYGSATIGVPVTWSLEPGPQTVGDQLVRVAIHYVHESEPEPSTYEFTYGASRPMDAVLLVYRGVKQDVLYDPVNYPFGYYAPSGSVGTAETQTAVALVSTPAVGSSSFKAYSRAVFLLGATHGSVTPHLSDPAPFAAIRARVQQAKASLMVLDVLETPRHVSPLPAYVANASATLTGAIGFVRVLEPLVEADDSYDTYKAKVLRGLWPPAVDAGYATPLGEILTAVGGGDNDLGGLFGPADFLPDEVP